MPFRDDNTPKQPVRSRHIRRRRALIWTGAIGGVVAVALGGGYAWLSATSTVRAVGVADCHQVPTRGGTLVDDIDKERARICGAIGALSDAWAAQDAAAYGAAFTEDATYITFAGTYYSGRDDIVRSHAALFDGPLSDTRLENRFLDLQLLTDGVAVLTARGDNYEGEDPGELTKVQTYTLVRDGEGWKVASFQNTQRQRVMEKIQYLWMPDTRPNAEVNAG